MTVGRLIADSGLAAAEARALLARRLDVAREWLIAHPEAIVDDASAGRFRNDAIRRAAGEPLAYLLGDKEFFGRSFIVTADVLIPRPETELLVDIALSQMRSMANPRVLDLGTGSGCIAVTLALELPSARVTATDISAAALAIARRNAEKLGAAITLLEGVWYDALPSNAVFDVIVSNPPYVAAGDPHLHALGHEPLTALTDGVDGMSSLNAVVAGAAARSAPGGVLILEHGFNQRAEVVAALVRAGWSAEPFDDAAGHARVVLGRR